MKKTFLIAGVVLVSAFTASAQDYYQMETYLGYDFARFNSTGKSSGYIPSFNANGGSGQFIYNLNSWIAGVADAGATYKGRLNGRSWDTTIANFDFGPRFSYRMGKYVLFGETLFGADYATTSTRVHLTQNDINNLPPDLIAQLPSFVRPGVASVRLGASNTGFSMLVGGGLDIQLMKHINFRPVEADYYLGRIPDLVNGNTKNTNNFRYSGGIVFTIGSPK